MNKKLVKALESNGFVSDGKSKRGYDLYYNKEHDMLCYVIEREDDPTEIKILNIINQNEEYVNLIEDKEFDTSESIIERMVNDLIITEEE